MLYLLYVDNTNMILKAVKPGTRFINNKLSILHEAVAEDHETPPAKLMKNIVNSIITMLVMEEDFSTNHPTGRLPVLDLEVWVEDDIIRHQHSQPE